MIKRYSNLYMKNIWNDEHKFACFLEVELASLEAFTHLGIIPRSDYQKIKENAYFDVDTIEKIEAETKHDVIAFTRAISLSLGQEKKWFHYGLTSTDVVDSANSLMIKKANDEISKAVQALLVVLKTKAREYQKTPCIGRTHGIHAEITSFGLKWALWYDELNRNFLRFNSARTEIEVVKLSGAVGNFSNIPIEVEEFVAKRLGLGYAKISTQVLSRDRHANYIFSLAQIASTLEKIAVEIRHLSRTEVGEVEEFFSSQQKGSSAMPHKRNPITSENICGCARIMRSYVNVALENNILWHERDISHSSTERIIIADATTLLEYMLTRYKRTLDKLVVNQEIMMNNISLTNNVVFSGQVLSILVKKGLSREQAYDLIQPLCFKAYQEKIDFKDLIKDIEILNDQDLIQCFNIEYYLKNIEKIYERVGI